MPNFPEKIASALMESIMAAFRTEAADLERARKSGRRVKLYSRPATI
jgi:hypothetical protein